MFCLAALEEGFGIILCGGMNRYDLSYAVAPCATPCLIWPCSLRAFIFPTWSPKHAFWKFDVPFRVLAGSIL
jgi:hypothetical protein